jgi:hypothetical protein
VSSADGSQSSGSTLGLAEIAGIASGPQDSELDSIVSALEADWSRAPKSPKVAVSSRQSGNTWDRQAVAEASIPDLKLSAAVDGACIECPAFLMRKNVTTFRVAADSSIHVASESSIPST